MKKNLIYAAPFGAIFLLSAAFLAISGQPNDSTHLHSAPIRHDSSPQAGEGLFKHDLIFGSDTKGNEGDGKSTAAYDRLLASYGG